MRKKYLNIWLDYAVNVQEMNEEEAKEIARRYKWRWFRFLTEEEITDMFAHSGMKVPEGFYL